MQYFKQLKKDGKEEEKDNEKKDDEKDEEEEDKNEEKKEEDKEGKKDGVGEKRKKNIPPLITSIVKKRPKMTRERWMEMAQIRRWSVRITNIILENLYKEPFDPFIEFVVGGDFRVIQRTVKKGKTENQYVGTLGYVQKTEVIQNLEPKVQAIFNTRIACEFLGSYFDVQEQFLRVDIWDFEKWNLNEFLGRVEIPLIEIIQGDVDQEFLVMKSGEKKKIKLGRLNFTISFEETWDFQLGFSDWSGVKIAGKTKDENPSPSLRISLLSGGPFRSRIKTKVVENEANPTWPLINGTITFRGTVNELDNQKLYIEVFDGGLLTSSKIGSKVTDLKGILDSGVISTDIAMKTDDIKGHQCSIKGRINILRAPKHRQTGDIVLLNSEGQYLCVNVMRVDNIILSQDKGVVNTFIEVSWGGYLKRTKTAFRSYKPIFNDTFYFPINVGEISVLGQNEKERKKAIMKELNLYSLVHLNFWSIDEQLSNDSLGSCDFFLYELQSAKIEEKEFFDEKTQTSRVMKVRVWSGKKKLSSPFIDAGEISNLFLEVWVLYEDEKKLDYDDLPKNEKKVEIEGYDELKIEWDMKAGEIKDSFPEETQRDFIYEAKDENDIYQFLPMFISKLGYPNPNSRMTKKVDDFPVDYLKIDTLAECNYYSSLIPYTGVPNAIWTSPEFLIHMKKGEVEDHAIFLACLLMNVKYETTEDLPKEETDTTPFEETKRELKSKFTPEVDEREMESRVFVCIGSLKQRKIPHAWVMTINKDCTGVQFWEPTNNSSYDLPVRIKNPGDLKKYLNKEEIVEETVKNQDIDEGEKEDSEEFDDKVEDALDDDSAEENSEDGENDDRGGNKRVIKDIKIKENMLDLNTKFRFKPKTNFEELGKKTESKFLENKREKEEKNPDKHASIVQEPKLISGASEVDVPYRTIDIIFNNKNIFLNLQHFDPSRIIYDIYDHNLWYPFVNKNFTAYPAFYTPPVLVPPLSLPQARRLHTALIKEMKIGISALRSGKNLGTSWKNQQDAVIEIMEKHLLFLEEVSRGKWEQSEIQNEKRRWSYKIRQFMPTLYRFNAYPAHFNYGEPDRIASLFIEKAKDFFCLQSKNVKWAVAARVFPYASKMISIRIIVGCFYPIPDGSKKN